MRFDIAVIGAGPAGMIAMLRLAEMGLQIVGIERNTPSAAHDDLRSTAFLQPAIDVLTQAGIWPSLAPLSTPLDVMEIVDATQSPAQSVAFDAKEIDSNHFGHNVMNADLKRILGEAVANHPKITLIFGQSVAAMRQTSEHVSLRLDDGQEVTARLIIGADGRNSHLRALLGIKTNSRQYDQSALVTTIGHEKPHNNISTEVHETGGPFTTVPIGAVDGAHASALVWLDKPEAIATLRAIDEDAFNAALNARAHGIRGKVHRIGAVGSFPMILQSAKTLHDHRAVLIGEAAHVVPPIGAQGLNMSLKDIESLARAIATGALEHAAQLDSWARRRRADIAVRKTGIDALNQISIAQFKGATGLRKYGLTALGRPSALRRGIMRLGLGS